MMKSGPLGIADCAPLVPGLSALIFGWMPRWMAQLHKIIIGRRIGWEWDADKGRLWAAKPSIILA